MAVSDEILDNMPWHALTGPQATFASGPGRALRFRRPVALFCATEHLDLAGWTALVEMVGPGRAVVLLQPDIGPVPAGLTELGRFATYQMVADQTSSPTEQVALTVDVDLVELGDDDVQDMLALTKITEPGPFFPETHRLGTYLGVRENGRLIAMAGERLKVEGVAEISAVCTHPEARRRGLGAKLTAAMMAVIRGRDELPLLHVATSNTSAIRVYEQLGFRVRCDIEALAARVVDTDSADQP